MSDSYTTPEQIDQLRPIAAAFAAADAAITAPGALYEMEDVVVRGETYRAFRDRPAHLRDVLERSRSFGDRPSVVQSDDVVYSFERFARTAASLAAGLRDRGVGKGDRVAIFAANSADWLLTFWATVSIGALNVAMNGWWATTEADHAITLTTPKLILGDERRLARLSTEVRASDTTIIDFASSEYAALREFDPDAELADVPLHEDDDAMLLFTSGTTGRPKAAILTHRNIAAFSMCQGLIMHRGLAMAGREYAGPSCRLAVFPLFHVSGLSTTVGSLMHGDTTVWMLGRFDPKLVLSLTERYGIKVWSGAITHIFRLLDEPALDDFDVTKISGVGIGGSATSPEVVRRTEARFPHLKGTFSSGYGSTETGGLVSWTPNSMLRIASNTVGPPLPSVEVKITDAAGDTLPDGVEGYICVRSPLVMREYWNHPSANAEVFGPGHWIRTGDFGYLTAGLLFVAARTRDLILRGGENIYPFEIEDRIDEHPDVEEVAVVGHDHPTLGQEVRAVVVVREGSTLDAQGVRDWCAQTLAAYKVPSIVEVGTAPLPRNPAGKVMKHVLIDPSLADAVGFVRDGE